MSRTHKAEKILVAHDAIQTARTSLDVCMGKDGFLDAFYTRLMDSSEAVRDKFRDTDFEKQKEVLRNSLYLMLVAAGTHSGPAHEQLKHVGHIHNRGHRDISPALYETWILCLMETVQEFDPNYTPELERDWRTALKPGVELLTSLY